MASAPITITPPSSGFTGWIPVDVSATPLAGVAPGTPVTLNPANTTSVNLATAGLVVAFVSAASEISFGVRLLSAPLDLLVSVP